MQTKDTQNTSKTEEQGLQPTAEKSAESSNSENAEQSLESILAAGAIKGFSDLNELVNKLNSAVQSEIEKAAKKPMLMKAITYLIPAGSVRNLCLDVFEPYIEDVDTLKLFIKGRFNVTMGKDNTQNCLDYTSRLEKPSQNYTVQPWTIEALHRAYHNLEKLPAWQVALVNNITTCNTTNGNGGVAYWGYGCYNVNYTDDPNQDGDIGTQDAADGYVCSTEDYYRRGLCAFDMTFTHELGHIVDHGGTFSTLPDFMAISGWVNEGNDPQHVTTRILSEIDGDPFQTTLNDDEIKVATDAAVMMVQDQANSTNVNIVEPYINDAADKLATKDNLRDLNLLSQILVCSRAYYTIARSFQVSNDFGFGLPCYNEPRRSIKMKHYVHEGYTGRGFYSYDSAARSFKISDYQYRDPGEEFAELYAAYHVSNGQNVGDKHKAWFEKMGLHKNDPMQTAAQVGISKTSGQKEEGQQDN